MSVATVTEGRMQLDFAAAVNVQRLDRPGAPLPHGMALVDFVVEETDKTLLLEIKDPEGAAPPHRQRAVDDFLRTLEGKGLIRHEIVPKARDSYTFLHRMKQDSKPFVLVCLFGVDTKDPALLVNFKDRLLARLQKETDRAWERRYVKDCVVATPTSWAALFPAYPLKIA